MPQHYTYFSRLWRAIKGIITFQTYIILPDSKITIMDLLYGYHVAIVNYAVIGFPSHAVWADITWLLISQIAICCLVI